MDSRKIRLAQIFIVVAVATIWELSGRHSPRVNFLAATPSQVLVALWQSVFYGTWISDCLITGGEALLGLVLGTGVGSCLGLLLWLSRPTAAVIRPFVVALGSFPVFALAPLMIVWFGIGVPMKVAFAMLGTVFISFNQALRGANRVSASVLEVMQGMRATRWQMFRSVVVPGSVDWVLAGLRINVGFALLGAFVGEFVAADRGLGYSILRSSSLYNVPRALAASVGIVCIALAFEAVVRRIDERRYWLAQRFSVPRTVRSQSKRPPGYSVRDGQPT